MSPAMTALAPKNEQLLSVVMPVFNERATIEEIVDRVLSVDVGIPVELVVVDDGSTDGTRDVLPKLGEDPRVRVFLQPENRGKGAALRRGFSEVRGDITIVQDADLEYDPNEYGTIIAPILDGRADVVYGSRFLGGPHRVLYFWHSLSTRSRAAPHSFAS
jgi:glycosyltransferase involved in cell wall biosynthesis